MTKKAPAPKKAAEGKAPKAAEKATASKALGAHEDLLLELHCEEIPARFLKPLTEELSEAFKTWAKAQGLSHGAMATLYSPRKMAWQIAALQTAQPDRSEEQVGPPQRLCVDEAGKPTMTGQKFAEKWGVSFDQVAFEVPAGKKEPVAVVRLTQKGRPTMDLLSEALPGLIAGLHVPKAMRWGKSEFQFVRPIRNVLCLLGEQVVPFTVDGVASSRSTLGHRLHHREHAEALVLEHPRQYEAALEAAGVVASAEERRKRLQAEKDALAKEVHGHAVKDEGLLDTLSEIVEWPRMVRGDFPADFLELPKEVLVTSLREHQKAFCIEDAKGKLLPHFLTAANRKDDPKGFVKSGNEWVLRARLYDARFFFAEDRKTKLADRLEALKPLTFQRELGSYYEKAERIAELAGKLAPKLGQDAETARKAGRLAKADLRTLMVGEFPELQGIMGGEYLRLEGAQEPLWMAVKEHYQPLSAEEAIPSTPLGGIVAAADKLDTVVGCFSVGLIPSGSKDPLALRRAGMGLVRIAWEQGWTISLGELIDLGLESVAAKATKGRDETRTALTAFFFDRTSYQLEVAGYPSPVRRSAVASGWADLKDLKSRCEALAAFAEDARFASLGQSAKRIANILKDENPAHNVDENVLEHESERILAAHLLHLEGLTDHKAILEDLAGLSLPLAAFFEGVMVKCENPALRAARLSLLHRLRQAFQRVADFSQWQ
jgi:glycyl-tRNA synthetase beta chain